MTNLVYKIRRKSDGLFSSGGGQPHFSQKGKTWAARGHVTSHLAQFYDEDIRRYYKDCEVVQIEIRETDAETTDVADWTPTKATLRAKELEEEREIKRQQEAALAEIARLEKKLASLKKSG